MNNDETPPYKIKAVNIIVLHGKFGSRKEGVNLWVLHFKEEYRYRIYIHNM